MSGIDIGPKIGIEGEKQFKDAIKAINSQIKTTGSSLKALAAESERSEDAAKNLSQRQKVLGESLDANKTKIKTLTAQYDRQKSKLDELGEALEAARKENGEGSDQAIRAENAYSKQAKAVNELETQINTAKVQISNISGELEMNAVKLQEAKSQAMKYGDAMKAAGDQIIGIGGKISKAGNALTLGITTPLLAAGAAMIHYASDAEESENKVDVSFKNSAQRVKDFADTTVDSYGIARGAALDMAALFGDMGTAMGLPQEQAAEMSTSLVGLAGDLASFKNIDLASASTALKGIFTGETESLKNLGIVMTDTNLQTWAMQNGLLDASKSAQEMEKQSIALEKAQKAYNSAVEKNGESSLEAREAKVKLTDAEEKYNSEASASWSSISQNEKVMLRYKYVMEQTKNAQGDYSRTADGTANSIRTLQESGKELAETFGKELLPEITPLVRDATKLIKTFGNLDDSQKKLVLQTSAAAAAAGPALKITGTATKGIGKLASGVGGLVKDIGKLNAAKKGAQAIGEVGSKAVKSVEGVSGLSKALFKLASPGGIALGAAGVLAGLGVYFLKVRDDAIKADIAAHFGNIKLSAEEVEDVVKRLTTTDWTVKIGAVVEAKAKLEQVEKDLESSVQALNTLDWKVQVGLELNEEETTAYQSAIDGFVKSAQEYVAQQGYTVSLALDATIGKDTTAGDGLTSFSNDYFASAEAQLQDLGERLAEKVNKSFENGTFAKDRIEIQKIVDQMNGVLQEIQEAEHAAKLDNMKIEYSTEGLGIDKESFDKLNEKISENTQELLNDSKKAQVTALTSVNLMYKKMTDSGIPEEFAQQVYEDAKSKIEQSTLEKQGDAINIGFDFAFDTVSQNYDTAIEKAKGEVKNTTDSFASTLGDALKGVDAEYVHWIADFESTATPLTSGAKKTVESMLEALRPQKETLQTIADDCLAAGKSVPESVKQGLSDIAEWESMAGNVDGMCTLLAQQISNSPEQLRAVQEAAANGKKIPDELAKAISMYSGIPYDANTEMFGKLKKGTELSAAEVAEKFNTIGAGLDETLAQSIASQYGLIYKNGKYMVDKAAQGVKKNTPIFEQASGDMAKAGVKKMDATTYGSKLRPPSMSTPYWTPQVLQAMNEMQYVLDKNPLIAQLQVKVAQGALTGLNTALSVIPHATGGIFNTPHVAMVAEESPGEAIIPLAPSRRRDAVDILAKTAEILNYDAYAYAADAGRSLGASRTQPAKATPPRQTVYQFEEGAIKNEINAKSADPEEVYRLVSRRMNQEVKRIVKGHGNL